MTTPTPGKRKEPDSITIVMSLPPPCLNPNAQKRSRRFAQWKAAEKRKARDTAHWLAKAAWQERWPTEPLWKSATVLPVFHLPDRRGLNADQDNRIASLKAHMDGIAASGLIENDRGLTWLPVQHFVDAETPRLQLTLTVVIDALGVNA